MLDGHHRVRTCRELGIEEKEEELKFELKSFDNPYLEKIFVIDTNVARRQLEPYSRVELVLLKKQEHLKLGKQAMSKAGEKGNVIKWYHHQQQQHQQQHYDVPPSTVAISAAEQEEEKQSKNIGFIDFNKPDNDDGNGSSSSSLSLSSSSFSTHKCSLHKNHKFYLLRFMRLSILQRMDLKNKNKNSDIDKYY